MFSYEEIEYLPTDAERQEAVSVLRLGSEHTREAEEDLREALAELRHQDDVIERVLAGER